MEANGRIQLFTHIDSYFNAHHSVSENYEDPFTKLHMHSMYELYLFLDGEGSFRVSGNSYTLSPGMIMFLRPGEAHSMYVSNNKRYERISIHFDGAYFENVPDVKNMLTSFSLLESGNDNCFLPDDDSIYCNKLFEQMTNPENTDDESKHLAIGSTLPALLFHLKTRLSHFQTAEKVSSDILVHQIIKFIDKNLYCHWSLDDLAATLYRDKAYLNRHFKKEVGTGIWDYTIKKRIISIKQRMHTFSNANEAFKASGFGDYSSFFRNYVKITGNTPSDDIKRNIGQ